MDSETQADAIPGVVELRIDHARPFVAVTAGSAHQTVAWLDTGGGPLIVGRRLADALGLVELDDVVDGQKIRRVELPGLEVSGLPLLTEPYIARRLDADLINEGFEAEVFIPAHVLAAHTVVFDYPGGRFEVHPAGHPTGRGEATPCPFTRRPGWPAIHARIGDDYVPLLLDTGASCCMLSLPEFERLTAGLPVGTKAVGAVGIANMSGGVWEASVPIARLPVLGFGPVEVRDVVVVARPHGTFEGMMSSGTAMPVVGALAGNALRSARVELYATANTAYVEPASVEPPSDDMSLVPLVLESTRAGVVIHGVACRDGEPLVGGIEAGDRLNTVDGVPVRDRRFSAVIDLLRGEEGQAKSLQLERDGHLVEVEAPVVTVV